MIDRKKKIRIAQILLLTFGTLIIIFTYSSREDFSDVTIVPKETQEKIKKQLNQRRKTETSFITLNTLA